MLAAYLVDQLDMHRSNQLAAGTPTARRDPCAACGLCCRSYLVPKFGHDVYRRVGDDVVAATGSLRSTPDLVLLLRF